MKKAQLEKMGQHIKDITEGYTEDVKELQTYNDFVQFVKDGNALIYFDECREFLKDFYNETDEEANRFSNEQVWIQYLHMWGIMANHKKYIFS